MGAIRSFLDQHFLHFNARETVAAARAYENHIQSGGKMLVTLAGAMSTAKLGQILARMIRADMVHAMARGAHDAARRHALRARRRPARRQRALSLRAPRSRARW